MTQDKLPDNNLEPDPGSPRDLVARHPWLTVSAATATGALLGLAGSRESASTDTDPDTGDGDGDGETRARAGLLGGAASALAGIALRHAAKMGIRRVIDHTLTLTLDRDGADRARDHSIADDERNNMNDSTNKTNGTNTNGTNTSDETRLAAVAARASDALDATATTIGDGLDATATKIGDGLEGAASAVSSTVNRATDGVSAAGDYLKRSKPRDIGGDFVQMVKNHPKTSIAIGIGVGLLLSRMLSK